MKNVISCLLVGFCFNIAAQTKSISGIVTGFSPNYKVYLKLYKSNVPQVIDSAILDKAGKFLFVNTVYPKNGLHQLTIDNYNAVFPIYKTPNKIEIRSSKEQLEKGEVTLKNSQEVIAYTAFLELQKKATSTLDSINKIAKQLNKFDKKYQVKSETINKVIVNNSKDFNDSYNVLAKQFPNTYTADVLVPLFLIPLKESSIETDTMYDTEAAFTHYHHFDKVNFKEDGTIYNNYFENKVLEYLKNYSAPSVEGIKESMDVLLRKSLVNINIKEHTVNYLLELAAQKNDFEIADYIFRNYYSEGCETNAKTEVKNMLQNIKRLSQGQPAPELEMINPDSKRTKLYDIKDKKLVLVYFWSSTCGHCRESIPNLKKLYEANREKGFEIYGVSLDSEYYNWAVYVEQEKLNWINVSELKGWQSKAVELYTVTGTPSYFLLDGSNFKIIARYSNIEQLEKELKQKL